MAYFRRKYYYRNEDTLEGYRRLESGYDKLVNNPLFCQPAGTIIPKPSHLNAKGSIACVSKNGDINVNMNARLNADEWNFCLAHNLLHLAFGHFDQNKIPANIPYHPALWNKACDIYVTRFLMDIGFGSPLTPDPSLGYPIKLNDEARIYEYLCANNDNGSQSYGTNSEVLRDMIGLEHPIIYKPGESNHFSDTFSYAITHSIKSAISDAGKHRWTKQKRNRYYKGICMVFIQLSPPWQSGCFF